MITSVKFTARGQDGKLVRFSVREPVGPNLRRNCWDRAVLIARAKGCTDLKFA